MRVFFNVIPVFATALYASFCPFSKPFPRKRRAQAPARPRDTTAGRVRAGSDRHLGVLGLLPLGKVGLGLDALAVHCAPRRGDGPRRLM
jgi:hypothetical protein